MFLTFGMVRIFRVFFICFLESGFRIECKKKNLTCGANSLIPATPSANTPFPAVPESEPILIMKSRHIPVMPFNVKVSDLGVTDETVGKNRYGSWETMDG